MQSLAKISKRDIHWRWSSLLINKAVFWIFLMRVFIILGFVLIWVDHHCFNLVRSCWKDGGESNSYCFLCLYYQHFFLGCGFVMGDIFKPHVSLVMVSLVKTRNFIYISPSGVHITKLRSRHCTPVMVLLPVTFVGQDSWFSPSGVGVPGEGTGIRTCIISISHF